MPKTWSNSEKFKCYKFPEKGIRQPQEAKKKSFELGEITTLHFLSSQRSTTLTTHNMNLFPSVETRKFGLMAHLGGKAQI